MDRVTDQNVDTQEPIQTHEGTIVEIQTTNPTHFYFLQGKSSDQIVYKASELIHVFVISRVPNKTIGLMK